MRLVLCVGVGVAILPVHACAQSQANITLDFFRPQTLISPQIPAGFDRGANVDLDSKPHPDYDPLPITAGAFNLFPTVEAFVGGTSNVYLQRTNPIPDMLVGGAVSLFAAADFGTSNFILYGRDWENVWPNHAVRSQDQGNIDASYQIELSDTVKADVEGAFYRYGDNNYIGQVNSLSSILLMTQKTFMGGRLQYESGRFSQIFALDRTHFNLDPLYSSLTGLQENYIDDHTVVYLTSETQYALTPSVAVIGELNYNHSGYRFPRGPGIPNYDSNSYRALVGLSLDIAGIMRGQVSAGYAQRDYRAAQYKNAPAGIIATKVELFPSEATEITLILMKDFDDGTIYSLGPSKYTTVGLILERELRENIVVALQGNGYFQQALSTNGTETPTSNFGASVKVKYRLNHHLTVLGELGGERYVNNNSFAINAAYSPNTEIRTQLTLIWRP